MREAIADAAITPPPGRATSRSTVVDQRTLGVGDHEDRVGVNERLTHTFRLLHRDLVNYCARRCDDRQRAEDVAQEIFARASVHAHESGEVPRWPWLMVAARRLLRDLSERHGSIPVESDVLDGPDSRHDPAVLATAAEDDQWLQHQLGELSADQRDVLVLTDRGWSTQEVARLLDLTTDNVRQLRHRARTRLQAAWAGREELHGLALLPLLGGELWDRARLLAQRFRERLHALGPGSSPLPDFAIGALAATMAVTAAVGISAPALSDDQPRAAAGEHTAFESASLVGSVQNRLLHTTAATPATSTTAATEHGGSGPAHDSDGSTTEPAIDVALSTDDVAPVSDGPEAQATGGRGDGNTRTVDVGVLAKTPAGDGDTSPDTTTHCEGRTGAAACTTFDAATQAVESRSLD